MEWSKEQLAVIESIDSNTLVSASAGSGKTAVMVERLSRLVREKQVQIKRIMVVTFTVDVAAELKIKITKMLREEMQKEGADTANLRAQLDDLPMCDISTFHSMCSNLIKSNFEVLGIDPSFSIIEEDSANLLFKNAVDEALKEYEDELDPIYFALIKYFGNHGALADAIASLYKFAAAQKDRDGFFEHVATSSRTCGINENDLVCDYVEKVNSKINIFVAKMREYECVFASNKMDKQVCLINKLQKYFAQFENFADFAQMLTFFVRDFEFDTYPRASGDDASKDLSRGFKDIYDEFKDEFKSWLELAQTPIGDYEKRNTEQKVYSEFLCKLTIAATNAFDKAKRADNKLDYGDLEYYAVKLLENDEVAYAVAASYDYICIDEYQDTNGVQEYIMSRISSGNNLFMVGDSKQSIYQFRMTDPKIFLNKYDCFMSGRAIGNAFSLNKNYRSSGEVLNFVNRIFDKSMTRDFGGVNYKKDSRLSLGSEGYVTTCPRPVMIARFDKEEQEVELNLPEDNVYSVMNDSGAKGADTLDEALFVAGKIAELVGVVDICELDKTGSPTFRKAEYSDIAILCQSRSPRAVAIVEFLKKMQIPIDGANICAKEKNYSINLIVDVMRVLSNFNQDFPLISVMSSHIGGFSLSELAQIKEQAVDKRYFFEAVKFAINNASAIQKKCQDFASKLDKFRDFSARSSVDTLAEKIIYDCGYDEFLLSTEGGEEKLAQLTSFVNGVRGKNYNDSLTAFINIMDKFDGFNAVEKAAGVEENCVKTYTVHSCKGLEFPIVFLVDSATQFNNADARGKILLHKEYGVVLRDINEQEGLYSSGLIWKLLLSHKGKSEKEEKLRLLYVALTRAKNMLFVSATKKKSDNEKEKSPEKANSFFEWIMSVAFADNEFLRDYYLEPQLEEDAICELGVGRDFKFSAPQDNICCKLQEFEQFDYKYQDATSLSIKYTVTEINNMAVGELVATEHVPNAALNYARAFNADEVGTAYHKVIECIDFACCGAREVAEAVDKMVEDKQLTQEQRQMINVDIIAEILEYPIFKYAALNECIREKEFMLYLPANAILNTATTDKVLLQGTIDMLILGEENILVDFKLTEMATSYIKEKYAKQLELYKLAAEGCLNIKIDKSIIVVIGRKEIVEM